MKKKDTKQKSKYISLKDAAKLSGYSSDYIGSLIRKGKIKGKTVSLTKAWFTTAEEVLGYRVNKKNKKGKSALKKYPKIQILIQRFFRLKKIINPFNILEGPNYGFIILLLSVIVFSVLTIVASNPKQETIKVFPTVWLSDSSNNEIGWQGAHNALTLELNNTADLTEFNSENSALSKPLSLIEPIMIPEQSSQDDEEKPTGFWHRFKNIFKNLKVFAQEDIPSIINTTTPSLEGIQKIAESEETVSPSGGGVKIILPTIDGELLQETGDKQEETGEEEIEEIQEEISIFLDESSISFFGFTLPEDKAQENFLGARFGISFFAQGREQEDDQVLVSWSLDDKHWNQLAVFQQNQEYSNSQNSGYFYFNIPSYLSQENLENLKIRFIALSNNIEQEKLPIYIDAVWLELTYEQEQAIEELEELEIDLVSSKKNFKSNEEPEFQFVYKKKDKWILGSFVDSVKKLFRVYDYWDDINTVVEIKDFKGRINDSNIKSEILFEDNGEFSLKIKRPKNFKPGLYKIVFKIEDQEVIKEFEQDFIWGVLAINVNKSIYLPSETAYIQMAALRDNGHTLCDANLNLEIISPDGITNNPEVQISGECGPNNVIDVPDYFSYYQTNKTGLYQIKLTNLDNGYEISDSFEVRQFVPFDVERIGPTRIYPPVDYEVVIKIKANQDFQGQIIETVPSDFEITNPLIYTNNKPIDTNTNVSGDWQIFAKDDSIHTKNIIWQVDWKQGQEYELSYQFRAPFRSPYLYFLGPLKFLQGNPLINTNNKPIDTNNDTSVIDTNTEANDGVNPLNDINLNEDSSNISGQLVFKELRSWQIAADAAIEMEAYSTPKDIDSDPDTMTGANTITITDANVLVVQVYIKGTATVSSVAWDPTGVNEALTLARADSDSNGRTEIWYKASPTVGTKDIKIDFSAAPEAIAAAFGLKNAHYPEPVNPNCATGTGCNGGTGTGTTASTTFTTQYDNSWIISIAGNNSDTTLTPNGTGQTQTWTLTVGGAPTGRKAACGSREAKSPEGSDTQSFTLASEDWAITAVEFREFLADVLVSATSTQTSEVKQTTNDFELGGKFVITHNNGTSTVTGIVIQEQGTVDAQTELSDVKLYYDLDTTTPFNCAGEDYAGGATQFGTSTTFNGANGTATFTNAGIAINQEQTMCVYTVFDVASNADIGDEIEIQITDPLSDVTLGDADVLSYDTVAISGTTTIIRAFADYTQRAYIWENDNGDEISSVDDNTQQAAGNTAITSVRKGERVTLRMHLDNDAEASPYDLALFYDRNDGIFTKVQDEATAVTGSGNCTDTNYDCLAVDDHDTENYGWYTSIAFDPSGQAWASYYDLTHDRLKIAKYVGNGNGTGCGTGSSDWTCTVVDDHDTYDIGAYTSIAFDPSGNAWVSYRDDATDQLKTAQYVGNGNGTGCGTGSSDWTCTVVDDHDTDIIGYYTSIAFDPSGNAWVSYHDTTNGQLKTAQYVGNGNGTGCGTGSSDWTCTVVDDHASDDIGEDTSIAFDPSGNAWVSYYDATNLLLKTAQYVGSGNGTGCGTGSSDWTCTVVDDHASDDIGENTSIAFDPSGNAWVSYYDDTNLLLKTAQYVGSGNGTGCGTGSSDWTCTVVDDHASDDIGSYTSIAFDPSGNAWVSYRDVTNTRLKTAQYVGNGNGTGCGTGSSDWTCTAVDEDYGSFTSIAFDPSGNAWVSYYDDTNDRLKIANITRGGEILTTSGLAGANKAAISESHCDMISTSDADNRDDADCVDGESTWVNGKWFESEEGQGAITAGEGQCTEVAFTIDTSQAVAGETYRFIVSLQDPWRSDKGLWRGASSTVQYATLTIEDPTTTRTSKDNIAKFADCTASGWGCLSVDDHDTEDYGSYTSIAFDPSGNAWVSYRDLTNDRLKIAKYVGDGNGTGCGTGSNDWTCAVVDDHASYDIGQHTSIAFGTSGNAWVSYYDTTNDRLKIAKYVGNGNGTGCGIGSSDWTCTSVDDHDTDNIGQYTSIAFDPSGNAWVSYYDAGDNDRLKVAQYVGSGNGTGCGTGSNDWTCTAVDDHATEDYGWFTSIAFDPSGNAWVSYRDVTNERLKVAQYVGSGNGTGCGTGSNDWTCTAVDDHATENYDWYTSIAFDPSGNAWVSYYDTTNLRLKIAKYVGNGNGTGCGIGSSDWTCTSVDDHDTDNIGQYTSIAFDSLGNPWVSYRDVANNRLKIAKYV
ncbi:hypothetical protein KAT95_03705, partial [Candidatus Parcubacteria bacterium]|nr:hypothetical protein [Candidatus Parcubacteria bacterium]